MSPKTTSATPIAAPTATRSATPSTSTLFPGEVPARVDLGRPDAAGPQDRGAVGVGRGRKVAVVVVRLELVLELGVVEKPVEVLSVAAGHEHGEARADRGLALRRRDGADLDDDEVRENRAHRLGRRHAAKDRRIDAREHADAVADLDVAADA